LKGILVPLDGSAPSLRAVTHLINDLKDEPPQEMEIHLINVQRPVSGNVSRFVNQNEIKQYHYDNGLETMREARELLDKAGVPYTIHIGVGNPAEIIAQYAKEKNCNQIIMGTHGRGEILGLLLGSVATEVIRECDIPVTLVK
jgi:nucleotide-binding universal stress UspA family protein